VTWIEMGDDYAATRSREVVRQRLGIASGTLGYLEWLAAHKEGGWSLREIARWRGHHLNTTRRHVSALVERGWVTVDRHAGPSPHGGSPPHLYFFNESVAGDVLAQLSSIKTMGQLLAQEYRP